MKRLFKVLFVVITVSLSVLTATFCGCSVKAEYIEGSFRITAVKDLGLDYDDDAYVYYEYQIFANKAGSYKIEYRVDYGKNLSKTKRINGSITFKESGVKTRETNNCFDGAKGLKPSDFKVSEFKVSLENSYTDDTPYFAIAVAFGVLAAAALAAGITLFVLDNRKKHGKNSVCAGECGEERTAETVTDGQEENNDTDIT